MKIVFLDRSTIGQGVSFNKLSFPHQWIEYPGTTLDQRIDHLSGAEVAITNKVIIDSALLDKLPDLKYISIAATGINTVDIDACHRRGIVVTNVTEYATMSVAEHTFMLILMLVKQAKPYLNAVSDGLWQKNQHFCLFIDEAIGTLEGKVLGLVGTGRIAQQVALIARAFGMTVMFYSPSNRQEVNSQPTLSLETLLASSDLVSVHCPLNEKTYHLFTLNEFQKMKPDAFLINTARGDVLNIYDLLQALDQRMIAGVGLDVLPNEPPLETDKIIERFSQKNIIVTPHTAWASTRAMQNLVTQILKNIERFYANKTLKNEITSPIVISR